MSFKDIPYRFLAKLVTKDPEAFVALGDAETRMLQKRLKPVEAPIYICGLARAGTTILTEVIARHQDVATHTYRDFPLLFTPYVWNTTNAAFDWLPFQPKPSERAHKDGILVTSKSPEAMEEVIWMAFFKYLHDETRSAVLGPDTKKKKFPDFYREHIQKLLSVRKKTRYASKANYNLTRISYLLSMFPDARFVIVIRNPVQHVWSLFRKDKMFRIEQEKDPATLTHMNQVGHFEFGKGRVFINIGDGPAMASVQSCFKNGDDVRGWAKYWAMLHRFIQAECETKPEVLVVRHEDMCTNPKEIMTRIYEHCRLRYDEEKLEAAAQIFHETENSSVPADIQAIIREETDGIAAHWGYTH